MKKTNWQLSYSAIAAFKACPTRFYHKYILGLVPIEKTESLRMGTNWHKILEIGDQDAVMEHLNEAYATVPMNKTKEEWETERIVLLYSFVGYNWYYQEVDAQYKTIANELKFELPLRSPISGRALPHVVVRGKIDKIFKDTNGNYYMKEQKSTGGSLDPDSTYWNHLNLDTQTRLYPWAAAQLDPEYRDIKILYDVWHKPTIRPKKLTQADSKKFVETGEYMGEKFEVLCTARTKEIDDPVTVDSVTVNRVQAEVEPGKKEGTFAIRETPEMFGARLLKDITERPEFYFCQKEIPRTADDLKQFEQEMLNIYRTMKIMNKNDRWWCCESQCEATFRCPYTTICYNNLQVNPDCPPEGFKNIFKKKETE